jgi:hypothetical protein
VVAAGGMMQRYGGSPMVRRSGRWLVPDRLLNRCQVFSAVVAARACEPTLQEEAEAFPQHRSVLSLISGSAAKVNEHRRSHYWI